MAENEKAEAATLPRIGELIDSATGGQVKYDSYSADQKLGRPKDIKGTDDPAQYKGLEAAVAAIVNHPEMKEDIVFDLLKKQAVIRNTAVQHDFSKILDGEKLDGLPKAPVVNGKVKLGGLFMSDQPSREDVIAQDTAGHASPEKMKADLAKLDKAAEVLKDPKWLVAEAASNLTNAARDAEISANGQLLRGDQSKAIQQGLKAEEKLLDRLEHNKPMLLFAKTRAHHLEHKVEAMMDASAQAAGIKLDDPAYKHYREEMGKNIDAGMENIRNALKSAGVQHAANEQGAATYAGTPTTAEKGKTL